MFVKMDEVIDESDEKTGEPIRKILKSVAHKNGIWHGSINIVIVNNDGTETLLQRRSPKKGFYPDTWDIAVGGHISAGEVPTLAAQRELQEELGLDSKGMQKVTTVKESLENNGIISNEFVTVFLLHRDIDILDIKLQEEEVSEAKWCTLAELKQLIAEKRIIPHVYFEELIEMLSTENKEECKEGVPRD